MVPRVCRSPQGGDLRRQQQGRKHYQTGHCRNAQAFARFNGPHLLSKRPVPGPAAGLAFKFQRSAVERHDPLAYGQPQTGTPWALERDLSAM